MRRQLLLLHLTGEKRQSPNRLRFMRAYFLNVFSNGNDHAIVSGLGQIVRLTEAARARFLPLRAMRIQLKCNEQTSTRKA